MRRAALAALWLAAALPACFGGGGGGAGGGGAVRDTTAADTSGAANATPVQMARVEIATLPVTVSGPGTTDVLREQRIRAPFNGVLTTLHVVPGDRVRAGETLGTIVEQTSYAALQGALSMQAAARTSSERSDAARALARQNLVETPLTAPAGGVVLNRSASPGEHLAQGDSIVTIAATGSLVFMADLAQSDIPRIHAGERVSVELTGRPLPIPGTVQTVLPADSGAGMTIGGTRDAIIIGVLLAALVLFVFLRKWKLTLIAVVAIPITVAIVALFLGALGQTINLMTLAGVAAALGLIADDAIVVIEDVERREQEWKEHPEMPAHQSGHPADLSVREIRPALIGSSLSTTVILLPFALLSGVVGAFFKPLALTMAITLVVSFVIALIAVPVSLHAFVAPPWKKRRPKQKEGLWVRGQGAQLMQPLAIAVIGGFVLSGPIVLLVLPGLYRLLDPHGRLAR